MLPLIKLKGEKREGLWN